MSPGSILHMSYVPFHLQSQYRCLHEVLQEWLMCRDSDLTKNELMYGTRWNYEIHESRLTLPTEAEQLVHQQFQVYSTKV